MGEHFIESDLQGARLLIDLATTNKSWSFLGSCACRSSALRIRSNYKNTEIEVEEENIINCWYPTAGIESIRIPLIPKCHLIWRMFRQHQNLDLIWFLRYIKVSFVSIIFPYIHSVSRCFGLMKTTKEDWVGSDFEGTSGTTSVKLQAHLVGVQLRIQSGLIS